MVKKKILKDKVIVISGGSNGVGKAAAEECALCGAKVMIGDHDEDSAKKVVKRIRAFGGQALFCFTELTQIDDCRRLFDRTFDQYGKIDGFFSYAGITPISPLDSCDEKVFDAVMDTNFKAAFFCCQRAIKYMRLNGGGSIILTGSAHGWGGQKDRAAYACSKGVLRILNEHIAHQYASEHIRCNYLTLGWTPTEGELAFRKLQGISEKELRISAAKILPMGRMCEPADYIAGIIYMLSDESSLMTGSTFRLTAGEYI